MLSGGSLMLLTGLLQRRARFPFSKSRFAVVRRIRLSCVVRAIIGYTAYIWLLRHCAIRKVYLCLC